MQETTFEAPVQGPLPAFRTDRPLPAFRARRPWLGADLQTVRNLLRGPVAEPRAARTERVRFPMLDGDVLLGRLDHPAAPAPDAPTVVLIHGLSGCEESAYLVTSAAFWLEAGHPVLRLNLRGAGPSRDSCRQQYHAGRTEDLREVLAALPRGLDRNGLLLVGYSLGGNALLKFLAESGRDFPVVAGASVSAPIDLAESSRNFLRPRNRIYHTWMLSSMRNEALGEGARTTAEEQEAVRTVRSIWEFDERFVAPRNGFRDAAHYYEESHARRFLGEIPVPTLLVHALDDPWIPGWLYRDFDWSCNPNLEPLLPAGGGHVGFHSEDSRIPWHDRAIAAFHARTAARPSAAAKAAS